MVSARASSVGRSGKTGSTRCSLATGRAFPRSLPGLGTLGCLVSVKKEAGHTHKHSTRTTPQTTARRVTKRAVAG